MTVLILARDLDPSADAMVEAVQARGVGVQRVNTGWFPAQLSFAAELRGSRWCGHLRTPAHTIDLAEVTAVYYRAPEAFQFSPSLAPEVREHAFLEAKYGLGGLLASLPAVWVNHPSRMADAAYKPVQLAHAHECGLEVPDTLLTNEAAAFARFTQGGRTVTKMLGNSSLNRAGVHHVAWTRVLDAADLDDLRGIETTAHLGQRWVPKSHEARVVAIGGKLITVGIFAATAATYVDWRADQHALTYRVTEPPEHVADGIRLLMSRLGLLYAALDFVITPEGHWIFLEVNPGGQYGWLDGLKAVREHHDHPSPITAAIAEALTTGAAEHKDVPRGLPRGTREEHRHAVVG